MTSKQVRIWLRKAKKYFDNDVKRDILLPCRTGHTPSLVNYLSRREA
jgi:hypothetical protein